MSSEETRIEEELVEEAMKAEDAGSVEKEIEKGEKEAAETEACAEDAAEEKTGEEEPAEEKQAEPEKKGFFGKKKEKKDPKDAKIEELTDRLQRNMAEFDNYRKRTEKEKSAMFEIGARDIIEKILRLSTISREALQPFRRRIRALRLQKEWKKYINSL